MTICGVVGVVIAAALYFLGGPAQAQEPEVPCVGEITGPGTATVTSGSCILLSYEYSRSATVPGDFDASLPQELFDQSAIGTGSLIVDLPPCLWQMDLVTADAVVIDTLTERYYGPNGWLIDDLHGGVLCTPDTQVTVPDTTTSTTTVESTTTSVPIETTVTSTPPSIPSSVPAALPRTGDTEGNQAWFAFGLVLMGVGFIFYANTIAPRRT